MAERLVGVSTWSLHEAFRRDDITAIAFAEMASKELGVEAFEYVDTHLDPKRLRDDDYYRELEESVEKVGGWVSCLAVGNDFTSKIESKRMEAVEYTEQMIGFAALLNPKGTPRPIVVRLNIGDRSFEDAALGRACECVLQLCHFVTNQGLPVRLAIENHGGVTLNPDNLVRLMASIKENGWDQMVGLCVDFGNFRTEDRYDGIAKMAPWTSHVHAKAYDFDEAGNETRIDFRKCIRPLLKQRFDGVWSIEYEGGGRSVADELDGTRNTLDLLKRELGVR